MKCQPLKASSPSKQTSSPPPPQLILGDEPDIIGSPPPPPRLILGDEPNIIGSPPPPPQLILGDDPNIIDSPPFPEFRSGDASVGNGSLKSNKLNILFILAAQTLLPMVFTKFI